MPYRRYRRRRGYRRRYRRRAPSYGQIGRKVYGDIMWLKKKVSNLNVEVKRFDTLATGVVQQHSGSATVVSISDIAQGDTDITRDGNSLKCTNLSIRLGLGKPSVDTEQTVRFMVFKCLGPSSAASVTELLEDPTTSLETWRNIDRSRNYKVLIDDFITMAENGDTTERFRTYNRKIMSHIKYDNSAGNSAQYGGLFYLIMTDEATNRASYSVSTRLRFVDN